MAVRGLHKLGCLFVVCVLTQIAYAQDSTIYVIDVQCDGKSGIFEVSGKTFPESSAPQISRKRPPDNKKLMPSQTISNMSDGRLTSDGIFGDCDLPGRTLKVTLFVMPPQERGECRGDWTAELYVKEQDKDVAFFPFFLIACRYSAQVFRVRSVARNQWEACARLVDYKKPYAEWEERCIVGDSLSDFSFARK